MTSTCAPPHTTERSERRSSPLRRPQLTSQVNHSKHPETGGGSVPMDADADGVCGIVLAGTYRWSASSFEALAARPLVPVALSPLISYALRWLRDGDVPRATICTNHSSRTVEAALGQGGELGLELRYYEDGTPRGAAGCVRDAGLPSASETFVVADGTAIPTVSLRELLASHRASGAAATAVVHRDRSRSGLPTPGGVYV